MIVRYDNCQKLAGLEGAGPRDTWAVYTCIRKPEQPMNRFWTLNTSKLYLDTCEELLSYFVLARTQTQLKGED